MIIAGVGICMLIITAAGMFAARRVEGDSTNYLVAGRSLPAVFVATLLVSQAVDSNATLGNVDLAAEFGFWAGAALPIGLALCLLLLGLFFARGMNASGVVTLPEHFERRFGRPVQLVAAVLTVVSFSLLLAGNLVALGFLFERFVGTTYTVGLLITIPVVLLYTMSGGMFASLFTSLVGFAITGAGVVGVTVWMGVTHGFDAPEGLGAGNLGQLTSASEGGAINWATIIALGLGNLVAIDLMQRVFSARSPGDARRGALLGSAGIVVYCVPLTFVAVAAVPLVGDADGPVLYALLGDHAPTWIAVLMISGVLAVTLTTISGVLLATSSVVVRDVLRIDADAPAMTPRVLRATRQVMVPMAAAGALVALRVPHTGILLTLTFDLLLASLVAPFVLGIFWRRGGTVAALAAVVTGITVRLVFFVLTPTIYGTDNTLLHFENDLVKPGIDGWSTLVAGAVSFAVYAGVAALSRPAEKPAAVLEPAAAG